MNKKFKKMIATVSAIAMCATSVISTGANAGSLFVDKYGGIYEEFTELGDFNGFKVTFNDEICGYALKAFDKDGETLVAEVWLDFTVYSQLTSEKANELSEFLAENYPSIATECKNNDEVFCVSFDYQEELSYEEQLEIAVDIYKNVNLKCGGVQLGNPYRRLTKFKTPLPEPTLTGDATEDGEVNIADAVLIMQSLSNPNEYKLTPQGMANADMDGDGVTALDALTIQQMLLDK